MTPARNTNVTDNLKNARAFYQAGQLDEARALYESILKTSPNNRIAIFQLSLVTVSQRDYRKSETLLKKVIKLDPGNPVYYSNLGFVLHEDNRPGEAVAALEKAISIKPDYADAYLNRANSLTIQGKIDAAIDDYRTALKINPGLVQARANMAYTMNFSPSLSEEELFDAHKTYALAITPRNRETTHTNTPTSDRKLRIGYLSSEFRTHSVAYFIEPVLEHHNRNYFEVFAYYNHVITDTTTETITKQCDHWRNVARLSDHSFIRQLKKDEIDILIDLNGYTAHNRLAVLAAKPVPVQCEWLGYPNTTGLDSMGYWICDATVNPPGLTDSFYSESLLRLPDRFICFKPPQDYPQAVEPPCLKKGYITFASFNNYAKISETILRLWADILKSVPGSRLILKSSCLGNQAQRHTVIDFFGSVEIYKDRLQLEGHEPSRTKHMERYSAVDIALDTFPYNGTTTTCEAMWMGVPTISLAGNSHRSRVGKTLLESVGLGELTAHSADQYKKIAVNLARDQYRLSKYRSGLREMVDQSPLTDAIQFTASLESAYRTIWKAWCQQTAG